MADMNGHYGNYRGEVVDVEDPTKSGRVRVNVFGVYDGLPVNVLPWAIYADPNMGGISEVGSFLVPELGAHVWVFFEGGDHHFPVYWAGAPAIKEGTPDLPSESRQDSSTYPLNKVIKTKSGILIERDDTPDNVRFRIYHPSGNDYLIDNDGNETNKVVGAKSETYEGDVTETYNASHTSTVSGSYEKSAAEVTVNSDGSVTIVAGGDAEVTASGNVNVTGATVNLN